MAECLVTGLRRERTVSRRSQLSEIAGARDGLQRILEAIGRGELTASSVYVSRLEGAISALDALLRGSHNDRTPAP